MSTIQNVIIIGASGGIGSCIFKALVESNNFNVSVLARRESKNTYADTVKVFTSDYSDRSLFEAFKGQDAVVSALGAAGIEQEIKLIDAATKAGVKRFIPSEFGCNTQNKNTTDLIPIFGFKAKRIDYLKEQESKGLSWTAIEAGAGFDYGLQFGLVGFNINTSEALIVDGGSLPFSTTNLSQIGNAVVAVLKKPAATSNQFIYIDSFTATQNEILEEFEKVTGKKWDVSVTTSEQVKKEGLELFGKGDFAGLLSLLKVIMLSEGYGSDFTKDATLSNSKLGLPDQSLSKTITAIVAGKPI
ncbi:hypothetical protein B0O99DRAFT_684292 [Bisporella sp. PMI_857]|nr:hypothetical protein B0O99DRAFT_684292 [Bisporella sp. PMI_857]